MPLKLAQESSQFLNYKKSISVKTEMLKELNYCKRGYFY
jgi:hypothetical protein